MMNIAVFCSGKGTNLQAIIEAVKSGDIKAKIKLVVTNVPDCYALVLARKAGIETFALDHRGFAAREEFDSKIIAELEKRDIELIVLAGYMRLLSPYFIKTYENKILNVHPALLPSFKGTDGIGDALTYGVKVTGVTIHFVNEDLDAGAVILQGAVVVDQNDDQDSLAEKIHALEHKLYPRAIKLFTEGKLKIEGRIVRVI